MDMNLKELKKELKEKGREDNYRKSEKILLEQAKLKELIETTGKCDKCGRADNLTLEHIIPRDILRSFGVDLDKDFIEENLGLTCKICNCFKGNRLDFSIPQTKEILIKLLERV